MGRSKRYSVARSQIARICRLVGVNYTEKTCKNFKRFIEIYVLLKQDLAYLKRNVPSCNSIMRNEARALFEAMIDKEEIPDDRIETLLISLCSVIDEDLMIKRTLAMVQSFEIYGKVYFTILYNLYFADETKNNDEVREMTDYSYGHFHMKKNEAIMLFGVTLWSEIIALWDNSVDDMKEIEDRNGRDNSLSAGRAVELSHIPNVNLSMA